MSRPPRVLLDASVLIPLNPRALFLDAARAGAGQASLCRVFWSEAILDEVATHIGRTMTNLPEDVRPTAVARIMRDLREGFPEALVSGYERFVTRMRTTDPDDRHVAAAAYRARVDAIITDNGRHFPPDTFAAVRYRPQIWTPDAFTLQLFHASPERLSGALQRQVDATNARYPDRTIETVLAGLDRRLPTFVAAMRDHLAGANQARR